MQSSTASRSAPTAAAALALIGGALALIGSFLSWAEASAQGFSASAQGIDGWEGKATIFGGILILVAGIQAFASGGAVRSRLKTTAILGGAVAAGVAIYTAATAKDQVVDGAAGEIAKELGIGIEAARSAVNQAIDAGVLKITLDFGIFVVIGGGILGIVAGLLAWTARAPETAMPAAPTGGGLTGWAAPSPPPTPAAPSGTVTGWAAPSPPSAPATTPPEGTATEPQTAPSEDHPDESP